MIALGTGVGPAWFRHNGAVTALFYDEFTDANLTSINAHTPDIGTSWTNGFAGTSGAWYIQGNTAQLQGGDDSSWNYTNALGTSDMRVGAQITTSNTGGINIGLLFRFQDNSNFLYARLHEAGAVSNTVELVKRSGGTETSLGTATVAIVNNTAYDLEIRAYGTQIDIYVDNVLVLETASDFLTDQDQAGIWGDFTEDNNSAIDNFYVYMGNSGSTVNYLFDDNLPLLDGADFLTD